MNIEYTNQNLETGDYVRKVDGDWEGISIKEVREKMPFIAGDTGVVVAPNSVMLLPRNLIQWPM